LDPAQTRVVVRFPSPFEALSVTCSGGGSVARGHWGEPRAGSPQRPPLRSVHRRARELPGGAVERRVRRVAQDAGRPASRRPISPALVLAVAIAAVSTGAVLVKLAEAPALAVATYRTGIAAALFAAVARGRLVREWSALGRAERRYALVAGASLALHFATWMSSLEYTSVASSVVLVNTSPVWVALAAPRVTGERITARTWLGVGVSLAGCALIGAADLDLSPRALLGDALAIAGAWAAALYWLAGRRVQISMSLAPYVAVCYGTAALVLLGVVLATATPLSGFGGATYGYLVLLALVPQVIGHTSYNLAVRWIGTTVTALATVGESLGASLLAWILLAERPSGWMLAGGTVALTGLAAAVLGVRQRR
jgi:drug/metabolite transporter (DMT)-like permease